MDEAESNRCIEVKWENWISRMHCVTSVDWVDKNAARNTALYEFDSSTINYNLICASGAVTRNSVFISNFAKSSPAVAHTHSPFMDAITHTNFREIASFFCCYRIHSECGTNSDAFLAKRLWPGIVILIEICSVYVLAHCPWQPVTHCVPNRKHVIDIVLFS